MVKKDISSQFTYGQIIALRAYGGTTISKDKLVECFTDVDANKIKNTNIYVNDINVDVSYFKDNIYRVQRKR